MARVTNRDAEAPYEVPRVVWVGLVILATAFGGLTLYAWRVQGNGLAALSVAVNLLGLTAAASLGIYGYAQFREWAAERHRFALLDLWLEIGNRADSPGARLREVNHEEGLPAEPMFTMDGTEAVVSAVVRVRDRFPLRNVTINLVVPADCGIHPLREIPNHHTAETVTPNPRVNPDQSQHHGVRYTVWTGELSPRQDFRAQVRISTSSQRTGSFRLMLEMASTPPTREAAEAFRFALISPARVAGGTED